MIDVALLAVDLDGTVFDTTRTPKISSRFTQLVQEFQSEGIEVTIATGRSFPIVMEVAQSLGIHLPCSTTQGAVLASVEQGPIWWKFLEKDHAKKAYQLYENSDCSIVVFSLQDNKLVVEMNKELWSKEQYDQFFLLEREVNVQLQAKEDSILKVVMCQPGDRDIQLFTDIYGESQRLTMTHPLLQEFTHQDIDKSSPLEVLLEMKGWSWEQVLFLGDNFNDVPVLKKAGYPWVMGSAPKEVQKLGKQVLGTMEEFGAERALASFLRERKLS